MKELNTIYDQVSSYIKQDSLERALEFLNRFLSSRSDGLNEFCLSKLAQLKQIENDRLLGVIRYNDQYLVIKNNIVTSLLEWVKINIPIDAIWEDQDNNYDNNIKIDIEELRWRLNTFLDLNGIKPVYTFLKVLTSNISKKYAIDELEEFHNEYVWKLNNGDYSINDWEEKSISLIEKIQYFIKHLDEKDLILKWKTKFIDLTMGLKVNNVSPLFALFSRADLIKVPTQIIDLSEHQRFKRLMYLYQDAYQAGEYKIAYEYCIQLREEIEPESAQLYEYLMLSYFKLQNEEEIISKALDGQMTALNYLFVYASRLNQLQEKSITDKKKIPNSETNR